MNRLKRLNIPLILGGIIVSILIFVALYGYQLIPLDPYATHFGLPKVIEGELKVDNPPHPTNDINIWGTDIIGRDVFSRVIYGTKLIISLCLVIALLRFLVALPFAFFAGFKGKISSKIIDIFNTSFSAIPALIFSYIILGFGFIRNMEIESAFIAYTAVLTFVGWGRVATILRDRIKDILSKDFIQGEIAIGKNNFLIAVQNVLPHLFASIIIYYFIEVSRALIIIAELGVLGLTIGVNKIPPRLITDLGIDFIPSYYPEWGSMLATAKYAITAWRPWIVLYPVLAIFISVLGFNLLGEGLKIELNKRNSKFIIFLKHIPYHLSPRTYIYQIRHIKGYKRSILIKTAIVLGVIIYFIMPSPPSKFNIDEAELYSHVEELSMEKYGGRELGTEGKEEAAQYIIDGLKESGIESLFKDKYTDEETIEVDMKNVKKTELYINTKEGKIDLKFREEYNLFRLFLDKVSETEYSGRITRKLLSYENFQDDKFNKNEKYFVVIGDKDKYTRKIFRKIIKNEAIDGIFIEVPTRMVEEQPQIEIVGTLEEMGIFQGSFEIMDIPITAETADFLKSYEGEEFVLDTKLEYIDKYDVKNIGGVIRGKDSTKPPMIIACNYDYKENNNGIGDKGLLYNGSSVAATLEIAQTLRENDFIPDRDIYFVLADASMTDNSAGSLSNYKKGMDVFRNSELYENLSSDNFIMFLNYLGYEKSDSLFLDTSLLYSDNKAHYSFTKILTKRAEELDLHIKLDKVAEPMDGITTMNANGSSGISIGAVNDRSRKIADNIEQDLEVIDKDKLEKQTQLIIDAITMYDYELMKGELNNE